MSKQSIKTLFSNPIVKKIQNKQSDILPVIDEVLGYWGYDLFSRKPGLAYSEDGTYIGTDLDLAVFLFALADRGAVINLPEYKSMRQTTVTEGTVVTSKDNRHGKVVGVIANKETFVFSVKIIDANVIKTDSVGEIRTFSLTDFDGSWYDGWKNINFMPDAKENEFINKTGILKNNRITFQNFVHPNRWTSIYGQYYFITKLLIDRITEEAAYYNTVIKDMIAKGVKYLQEKQPETYPQTAKVGDAQSIKVTAFEALVDFPSDNSAFPEFEYTTEMLEKLTELRKKLVYSITPKLRYAVRATECAFYQHVKKHNLSSFPSWVKGIEWEVDYIPKGKRTKYNRIVLTTADNGDEAAIRFRVWQKSEQVNEKYGA